jgi:hypothetical protein
MPGGYSSEEQPPEEVAGLAHALRREAEQKTKAAFARFEPVAYSQQVVAGMNYRIKARVVCGARCARGRLRARTAALCATRCAGGNALTRAARAHRSAWAMAPRITCT